ncbi:phosphatase PAP2 family protein [Flavobacterium sp. 7A]|uniref:phosphatase PAP2 family protein n=1 Tax=Flavobacterium sp. 7A TaxID=2940571 RepID=UPI002227C58A|nr:phosphatase PAP2 family protein [Flavobacterium sp. 7A]MCW2119633.1 hypothetical protein [Flavobacterium sp. 7A]
MDSLSTLKESRFKVASSVIKNGILSIPSDFSQMGHTVSSDWKRTAMYAGGIVGLIAVDKITTGFLHDKIEPNVDYHLPTIGIKESSNPIFQGNDPYITYPIMGLYAGSLILNNKKGQEVAVNAVKSLTYSFVISHLILKTLIPRQRPQRPLNGDEPAVAPWTKNQWDFGNFHRPYLSAVTDGTSFPSFHSTAFFAVAKVFQMEYHNYWIPYTFVSVAFLSDIKGHNHWISDLLVGGLVGTIIGKSIVISSRKQIEKSKNSALNYNPKKFRMTKQLVPQVSSNLIGFHFIGSF